MIKLYELPPTRSIRPLYMLQELGLEFETLRVDLTKGDHQQAAYLKVNPAAKLASEDQGSKLYETDLQTSARLAACLQYQSASGVHMAIRHPTRARGSRECPSPRSRSPRRQN